MPSTSQIRNFNLKVIFLIHFCFIALSLMGYWATNAYFFYNAILILLLIWSIHHDQLQEPLQLAIVVNGCSIILDVLLLVMSFPNSHEARERFSVAMCILHMIVRPFSTFLLIRDLETRSAGAGLLAGGREAYEDIDKTGPQASGSKTGGYNFATAEQI